MYQKIHVTGAFGFIGSNLVKFLNARGITPVIYGKSIDEFNWRNVAGLKFEIGDIYELYTTDFKHTMGSHEDILVHLGANVDTTESMNHVLWNNNFRDSIELFKKFSKVIYASSAATYGSEENDFSERIAGLKPLNAYGFSKWALDNWAFGNPQSSQHNMYGLRFFNVYGPNEGHKGSMKSVIAKMLRKESPLVKQSAKSKKYIYSLFRSGREGDVDGEQKRDFVYVEDVCSVIYFFLQNSPEAGVYNVGSGQARSFNELVKIVDPNLERIDYVPLPQTLVGSYQYFTQADLTKLRAAGYTLPFTSLEDGVAKTKALTS